MSNEVQDPTRNVEVVTANKEQAAIILPNPKRVDGIIEALNLSAITGSIGYNEIEAMPYVRGVLPWDSKGEIRPWNNTDDSYLFALLQTQYGNTTEKAMKHALTIVGNENRFNPVIDAMDALPTWDGKRRAGFLFHWYLGADNNAYVRAVERLFLSGIIMRTFHPGAKFDYMPVLAGAQGIGKSTLARLLALSDEFFTDSLAGIGKKEGAEIVQGRLIVEVAELDAIKGKDLETVKAFISRMSDDYRVPYKERVERHPRRFVLIGTTNSNYFLRDASGSRRFLTIRCGIHKPALDLFGEGATDIIKQVLAEMLHEYGQSGSLSLILPDEVRADAIQEQNEASVDDTRIGEIEAWLDMQMPNTRVCISQICEEALDVPRSRQQPWFQNEVREIMGRHFPEWKSLEKKQRVGIYGVQRVYQKTLPSSNPF